MSGERGSKTSFSNTLSEEVWGRKKRLSVAKYRHGVQDVAQYTEAKGVPAEVLYKIARFELFVERFVEEKGLDLHPDELGHLHLHHDEPAR